MVANVLLQLVEAAERLVRALVVWLLLCNVLADATLLICLADAFPFSYFSLLLVVCQLPYVEAGVW
jgi:hypothetical protein